MDSDTVVTFACVPACRKCREARQCVTQEAIEYRRAHRRAPYWPDSLAGTHMKCGCRVDIIPTVLGVLGPSHVWCGHHGWQPLTKKQAALDSKQDVPLFCPVID